MFKEAFAKRRALIPATGFFEWQKRADGKQPYRFQRSDLEPFAFAGLWEFARIGEQEILSATIIVGAPNPLAAAIHDRMPVILEPDDYDRWFAADTSIDELRALLKPYPAERMRAIAVNRRVNSVKNDDEACIEEVGEPPLQV
jgi:putative SOS response-associated peptidase YedK